MKTLLASLVALTAVLSYGQAPKPAAVPELNGVRIGMTMQEFLQTPTGQLPESKNTRDAGSKGLMVVADSTVGGAKVKVLYTFEKSESPNGATMLYNMLTGFPTTAANSVRDGLTQKYGNPTVREFTKTNRLGGSVKCYEAKWTWDAYEITLASPGSKMDETSLTLCNAETVRRLAGPQRK